MPSALDARVLRTGWLLLSCFPGGFSKDQPQIWTGTFLQTFATAGPSWGLLKVTLSRSGANWQAGFLDAGRCAWDAPRHPLQCQHAVLLFRCLVVF